MGLSLPSGLRPDLAKGSVSSLFHSNLDSFQLVSFEFSQIVCDSNGDGEGDDEGGGTCSLVAGLFEQSCVHCTIKTKLSLCHWTYHVWTRGQCL